MDIQEIKATLRKGLEGVTPGPWRNDHSGIYGDPDQGAWSVIALTRWRSPVNGERLKSWNRDSAHVANCDPDTIAALLADHDAITAERDRLKEALQGCVDGVGCQPGYLGVIALKRAQIALGKEG